MIRFCQNLLTASIHGSVVILAVMLLRLLLKKTPRKYICFLWMLAGIRLLMPISVQSAFSLQPTSIRLPAISSQLFLQPVPTASQSVVQQKTLTSDVARCWAVELWRARYRNQGQIVVGRSIDVNAQFADQE